MINPVPLRALNRLTRKFQFHKGTIKPLALRAQPSYHDNFNSIKVRLNRSRAARSTVVPWNFNSIKVRLNLLRQPSQSCIQAYFNSIKVRLNLDIWVRTWAVRGFQFHKGTIKPSEPVLKAIQSDKFQFHKGTIKPVFSTADTVTKTGFQFHKGTIKPLATMRWTLRIKLFQFHKGTIKPPKRKSSFVDFPISIP